MLLILQFCPITKLLGRSAGIILADLLSIPPELEQYGDFFILFGEELSRILKVRPMQHFGGFLHIYFRQKIGKKDLTPPIPLEIRKIKLSAL
jgi:hypothetical protein